MRTVLVAALLMTVVCVVFAEYCPHCFFAYKVGQMNKTCICKAGYHKVTDGYDKFFGVPSYCCSGDVEGFKDAGRKGG